MVYLLLITKLTKYYIIVEIIHNTIHFIIRVLLKKKKSIKIKNLYKIINILELSNFLIKN